MDEPLFDEERANALIGKSVLIGLTYVNADGSIDSQVQHFGRIVGADETMVTVRLHDSDEDFTLPPALDAFEEATPGEYRLRGTGEVIVDPDLLSTWTISAPEDDEDLLEQDASEQDPGA
jgi:hypothetical protein